MQYTEVQGKRDRLLKEMSEFEKEAKRVTGIGRDVQRQAELANDFKKDFDLERDRLSGLSWTWTPMHIASRSSKSLMNSRWNRSRNRRVPYRPCRTTCSSRCKLTRLHIVVGQQLPWTWITLAVWLWLRSLILEWLTISTSLSKQEPPLINWRHFWRRP